MGNNKKSVPIVLDKRKMFALQKEYIGKKVLIVGGADQQALPMIRAFHEMGCFVEVLCNGKLDVGYVSRYTDKAILGVCDENNIPQTEVSIRRTIRYGQYDLVVPMNDFSARILSKNKAEYSENAFISVNDYDVFSLAIEKKRTMQICMDNGISCPKTYTLKNGEELHGETFLYPLVVKPNTGFGAQGFHIVHNKEELDAAISQSCEQYGEMLVQEYIPQTKEQYQVEMFMNGGECVSIVVMDKVRWYPLEGGSSTVNITVKDEAIERTCIHLLQTIGWQGYASLDLIRDPRDGIAKVLEINPRVNGTVKICFAAGLNVAKQFMQEALHEKVTEQRTYTEGIVLRYFHKDILWFLKSKERFHSRLSWFSWKNTVDEIFDCRDIVPIITYSITSFVKLVRLSGK